MGRDAYAYQLNFYEGDYLPINPNIPMGSTGDIWTSAAVGGHVLQQGLTKGLFNGNIPIMVTDLKKPWVSSTFVGGEMAYAYQYDQLNRLKQVRSAHRGPQDWLRPNSGFAMYDAGYSYDRNGNIESLYRMRPNLQIFGQPAGETMDNLTYFYPLTAGKKTHNRLDEQATNRQLARIPFEPPVTGGTDIGSQLAGNYSYDAIGNLVGDYAEHISPITWDLHGKVRRVQRDANGGGRSDLAFWYDGTGNRVHKRVTTPGSAGGPDIVRDGLAVF